MTDQERDPSAEPGDDDATEAVPRAGAPAEAAQPAEPAQPAEATPVDEAAGNAVDARRRPSRPRRRCGR